MSDSAQMATLVKTLNDFGYGNAPEILATNLVTFMAKNLHAKELALVMLCELSPETLELIIQFELSNG
jgi:hypothetical protein